MKERRTKKESKRGIFAVLSGGDVVGFQKRDGHRGTRVEGQRMKKVKRRWELACIMHCEWLALHE
jgi:hypothetical protein